MEYLGHHLLLSDCRYRSSGWLAFFLCSPFCLSCSHSSIHPTQLVFYCVLAFSWNLVIWKRRWVPFMWISFLKFPWWLVLPGYTWACWMSFRNVFLTALFSICSDLLQFLSYRWLSSLFPFFAYHLFFLSIRRIT